MGGADAVYGNTPYSIFAHMRPAGELHALIGQSFSFFGLDSFASADFGGRWRDGPPADEATLDATAGTSLTPRWLLLAQSFSAASVDAAERPYHRYILSKTQLSTAYRIFGGVWLQGGGFITVAHAHTGSEHGGLVSLWWKF